MKATVILVVTGMHAKSFKNAEKIGNHRKNFEYQDDIIITID